MYAIQVKSPKTKYRWYFVDGKASDDPATLFGMGGKWSAHWVYESQSVAVKFAERYRDQADEDTEWRVVKINDVGEVTFA